MPVAGIPSTVLDTSTLKSLIPPGAFLCAVQAFAAAGHVWTKELCQADSDGDGATNGAELGDPNCNVSIVLSVCYALRARGGGGDQGAVFA